MAGILATEIKAQLSRSHSLFRTALQLRKRNQILEEELISSRGGISVVCCRRR
jgi:hypothetical protein